MTTIKNEPLNKHCSFKIGGPADTFLIPDTKEELIKAVNDLNEPIKILGGGTNILVSDEGFRGTVIKTINLNNIKMLDNNILYAEAGANLASTAMYASDLGIYGFVFGVGIPGTVGGAVCMNSGAFGSEISEILISCDVLLDGKLHTFSCDDMKYGYRKSIIHKNQGTILSALFQLREGDRAYIKSEIEKNNNWRRERQPISALSAGSTFKRATGHYTGKLIEDSGLKGFSIGGASVSQKHAGFIINKGDATAKDVYNLIQHIIETVYNRFGVKLEPEVQFWGNI